MPLLADIHNHMLFGLDDGAPDLAASLRLLDISYREGVRLVCLTPHCNPDLFPHSTRARAEENFAVLRDAAAVRYPDLTLLLGNELFAFGSSLDAVREGACRQLGDGNTLLVEFSPEVPYTELVSIVRAVRTLGYRPLIAHAERYECLLRAPERVEELVSMRARIQINASTVTAGMLSPLGRFARRLLRERLVHVVASDGHGERRRTPHLLDAYRKVASLCGDEVAEKLFYNNPRQYVSPKENQ